MDELDVQQVLATATKLLDRLAANLFRDHGICGSEYEVCAEKMRRVRSEVAAIYAAAPRYTLTEAGRKALEGEE